MTERFKTDVRMRSQFGPLEGQTVDNPWSRDETGVTETLLGTLGKGGGSIEPATFLASKPETLQRSLVQAKRPLNATLWKLFSALKRIGLPIETGTGGRTRWNRARLDVPKAHATDAAYVQALSAWCRPILLIRATGRGAYQRTRLDRFGFPRSSVMRAKASPDFRPATGSAP